MPDPTIREAARRGTTAGAPAFDDRFRDDLDALFRWRRDVRRFRPDPPPPGLLDRLLTTAARAPSVGHSRPWRFVRVETGGARAAVAASFRRCNAEALADQRGERARLYATLKLAGLDEAPVHLAVFCDRATGRGHGLGRRTMPETLDYSAVLAVHTLWLAARAHGLGVGWVSILDPAEVTAALDVPPAWKLVAYLCLGYPEEDAATPELERAGWEDPSDPADVVTRR